MKIQRFRHTSILCARLINYTSPFISGDICCWKVSFSHQTSWQVRPQGRRVCQSLLKQYWQEIRTERCSSSQNCQQNINATSCASFYLSSNLKPSAPEQKPWPAAPLFLWFSSGKLWLIGPWWHSEHGVKNPFNAEPQRQVAENNEYFLAMPFTGARE